MPISKKKSGKATADESYSVLPKRTKETFPVVEGTTYMHVPFGSTHWGVQSSISRHPKQGLGSKWASLFI